MTASISATSETLVVSIKDKGSYRYRPTAGFKVSKGCIFAVRHYSIV